MASKFTNPRRLGKDGPFAPALGFGLMMMTTPHYGPLPQDDERFALLDKAVELGATFWDGSDLYGDNEELLAQWFKRTGKRDQIFLASKFGYGLGGNPMEVNSSAEYCKQACNRTLDKLGVDFIDLYYAHNVDKVTPIEETMKALVELQSDGKIKHIGLSMVSGDTLRRAVKVAPVAAYQPGYSLFERAIEGPEGTNALAVCRELGIAVVCASPLGRGVLTHAFVRGEAISSGDDVRTAMMPHFQDGARQHNAALAGKVKTIADRKGCTLPQLALAWLLKQGDDVFPIPSTRRIAYLEDNMGALEVRLTDDEEAELRRIVDETPVSGASVPDAFAPFIFRDTKEL